jgi:hypothetical protein
MECGEFYGLASEFVIPHTSTFPLAGFFNAADALISITDNITGITA